MHIATFGTFLLSMHAAPDYHAQMDRFQTIAVAHWEQHEQFGGWGGGGEETFIICLLLIVSLTAQFLSNYAAVTGGCYNQGFWNCRVLHCTVQTKLISCPFPHVPRSESRWEAGHKHKGCVIFLFQSVVHYDPFTNKSSVRRKVLSSRIHHCAQCTSVDDDISLIWRVTSLLAVTSVSSVWRSPVCTYP
jgi:hypothetical protein